MKKSELRDKLFEKYFEVTDGLPIIDLITEMSFIRETWSKLHQMCEENIEHFDYSSRLSMIKLLQNNNKKYLILKFIIYQYCIMIINGNEKKGYNIENIAEEHLKEEFDEDFFIENFSERKYGNTNILDMIIVDIYNKDKQKLLDFYNQNKDTLSLSAKIYYPLRIGEALTYLNIDFKNDTALLGFETPDQFLYEQIFLNSSLTPLGIQDAKEKIGSERMQEIFEQIKTIIIPKEIIPNDIYQVILQSQNTLSNKKFTKNSH